MKLFFQIVFLFLIRTSFCFSQEKDSAYFSSEEEKYFSKRIPQVYRKPDLKYIESAKPSYVKIKASPIKTNKFKSIYELTEYDLKEEKLRRNFDTKHKDDLNAQRKYFDSVEMLKHRIGEFQTCILREDSFKGRTVIFYKSYDFKGYAIAISNDGNNWKKYYTGLMPEQYYYVKPTAKMKLIKNDSVIQLEIAIVRKKNARTEKMKDEMDATVLLKDDLVMEINLNEIIKDSDNDGLTNILEKKYKTDPLKADTDGDGLNDDLDSNPLYPLESSEWNIFYQKLLSGCLKYSEVISKTEPLFTEEDCFAKWDGKKRIYTVQTENPEIKNVHSAFNKYIILTDEGFENQERSNVGNMEWMKISPLFKVDNKRGYYKIQVWEDMSTYEWLIKETPNEFIVELLWSIKI